MRNKRHMPTYQSWQDMKQRCMNERHPQYKNYGARGIAICERWLSYPEFLHDMGERSIGLSIDRIDVNGNYEPSNCRWANSAEQRRNQRDCLYLTHNGMTKTAEEWGREMGYHGATIRNRKRRGWSDSDAISTPRRRRNQSSRPDPLDIAAIAASKAAS